MRKIATIRRDVLAVIEELDDLRAPNLSRDEAAARLDAWVDEHAREVPARHFVTQVAGHGSTALTSEYDRNNHPMKWLCWMDPSAMKKALKKELDAVAPEVCSTLSADERAARIAELESKRSKLEAEEEGAIEAAEEGGGEVIPRRPDADPAIILGAK